MANFERITDTGFWEKVAYALGGYMGAMLLQSKVSEEVDMDIPNEAYGVGMVAVGSFMGGQSGTYVSIGGGLHSGERLVQRLRNY